MNNLVNLWVERQIRARDASDGDRLLLQCPECGGTEFRIYIEDGVVCDPCKLRIRNTSVKFWEEKR